MFVFIVKFPLRVKFSTVALRVKSALSVKSRPTGISSTNAVTFGPIIPSSWNIIYSAVSLALKSSSSSYKSILSPLEV